uniref:Glycoprotein nmb n=1 Tax=Leptobrachium leishanense TaxID=445787 RepID=A0A8C5PAN7_9ANUR
MCYVTLWCLNPPAADEKLVKEGWETLISISSSCEDQSSALNAAALICLLSLPGKMRNALGLMLVSVCLISGIQAIKRFQDVKFLGKEANYKRHNGQIHGWAPDSNAWDEQLYPAWEADDARWENCWKGGKVKALLTSDSPALIGSNITFVATLQFPRCQKENEDGDIVYDTKCINDSSVYQDQYVYNWTKWVDYCGEGNCSFSNKFPDGRPFPSCPDWRRRNFIYIFQTLGQYYVQTGRSSAVLSINTTNITVGSQIMEVSVYRRGHRHHSPVAKGSGMYIVTDQIPFYVNISQKNDRISSDDIFIKDSPIQFDVLLHDPSNYLSRATVSFNWTFGDGNGSFVSNNPISSHNYTLVGNFTLNLTVKAAFPAPCQPTTPTPMVPTTQYPTTAPITSNTTDNFTDSPFTETDFTTEGPNATTEVHTTVSPGCFIKRYGYYTKNIRIVDGILAVNILEMNSVSTSSEAQNTFVDFMVSCEGSVPTDACTLILDSTCSVPQNEVCDKIETSDQCLVILRRAFTQPGTYCVNITLSDDTSVALASTLVSVKEGYSATGPLKNVLICLGVVVVIAALIGALMYNKYKGYKPIANASDHGTNAFTVSFNNLKSGIFKGGDEKHPLLKNKAGII